MWVPETGSGLSKDAQHCLGSAIRGPSDLSLPRCLTDVGLGTAALAAADSGGLMF